ncbi:unnamed protein product [Moneuplotes crassus]|uniref:Trafficking protein particle complex subunit n=1 Tax=Euplotes crassus TaxID=5936 RepID=A0AAD2D5N7_EUPCR|nr:unnamed protein product [Moneuplotes crassus]
MFSKSEKISVELLSLTYGTFVARLLKENDNAEEVNLQLHKIGSNIGNRLIDEFLSKSRKTACKDFREIADVIAKYGFKMYLGVTAEVAKWNEDDTQFSIYIENNPLSEFVMLPIHLQQTLWYSNLLCGVIKGALEKINVMVECEFKQDTLRGHDSTEIIVKLVEIVEDRYEDDEM